MVSGVGRYEILEELGRGGFAVVYRAHDRQLDRLVALKELRPMLLNDPGAVKEFRQEARNIARLDHPNVVTIYDVYEAEQQLFIVMQLVDGSSLAELITRRGHLSWPETVEMIPAVAKGLDYAHTQGILHRDLKPANILLDSNHGPMLSDFGLAKLINEAGTSVTAGGGMEHPTISLRKCGKGRALPASPTSMRWGASYTRCSLERGSFQVRRPQRR